MHIDDLTPGYSQLVDDNKKLRRENTTLRKHLRDEFAIAAMNAIVAGNGADECVIGEGAAKDAYIVADAMMKVREL